MFGLITLLFHMIPAVGESSTRLPPGAPLVASLDSPVLQVVFLALLAMFLIGVTVQVRWLRQSSGATPSSQAPRPLSSQGGTHAAR